MIEPVAGGDLGEPRVQPHSSQQLVERFDDGHNQDAAKQDAVGEQPRFQLRVGAGANLLPGRAPREQQPPADAHDGGGERAQRDHPGEADEVLHPSHNHRKQQDALPVVQLLHHESGSQPGEQHGDPQQQGCIGEDLVLIHAGDVRHGAESQRHAAQAHRPAVTDGGGCHRAHRDDTQQDEHGGDDGDGQPEARQVLHQRREHPRQYHQQPAGFRDHLLQGVSDGAHAAGLIDDVVHHQRRPQHRQHVHRQQQRFHLRHPQHAPVEPEEKGGHQEAGCPAGETRLVTAAPEEEHQREHQQNG